MSRRRIEDDAVEGKLAEASLLIKEHGGYAKYVEMVARGSVKEDEGSNDNWLRPIASHILGKLSTDYPEWAGEDNISSTDEMDLGDAVAVARANKVTRGDVTKGAIREIAARGVVSDPDQLDWLTRQIKRRVAQLSEDTKKT